MSLKTFISQTRFRSLVQRVTKMIIIFYALPVVVKFFQFDVSASGSVSVIRQRGGGRRFPTQMGLLDGDRSQGSRLPLFSGSI
jgi:hypothetical protein